MGGDKGLAAGPCPLVGLHDLQETDKCSGIIPGLRQQTDCQGIGLKLLLPGKGSDAGTAFCL